MAPYRGLGDEQPLRDSSRRQPLTQAVEHVPLSRSEIVLAAAHEAALAPSGAGPEFANQPRGELTRERRLAAEDARAREPQLP